eukprot:gene23144-31462_t
MSRLITCNKTTTKKQDYSRKLTPSGSCWRYSASLKEFERDIMGSSDLRFRRDAAYGPSSGFLG